MAFASVYPLVTARSVARPFTYEVPDEVRPGAVVEVRFGNARRRGVVVEVGAAPPEGIKAAPIKRVVDEVPAPLVELALWIAGYYGSTPARALELDRAGQAGAACPSVRSPPGARRWAARRSRRRSASRRRPRWGGSSGRWTRGSARISSCTAQRAAARRRSTSRRATRHLSGGWARSCSSPEIGLTPQAVGRFRARFGDRIAILHSALGEAERRDERVRIASGEARVVIGARSAVFAPVRGLGLICVDEEHDASYKQESDPRYDARTVAAKRASLEGAVAVYGSATPRPESWERLERLELGGRLAGPLPPVRVVDLRYEKGYPLSAPLLAELAAVATGGGRAILLLNRRGVAPALHCRACGQTIRCPNCDVSLVLHKDGFLRCHHCGYDEAARETCPSCTSPELARLGAGTQRLERELAAQFPELALIRLDADTVKRPGAAAEALARFAATERAVLVGTQMVAKGHHFEGVALAAVVDADTGLGLPDFRAEERTFQLLTQLAGRSGRDAPGRVLVQTFQPDARAIRFAARHDVGGFLTEEIERRRELGYPPFRHLVRIVAAGPEPDGPARLLTELKAGLGEDLLGPAPLLRLRGRHRAQLVAKTEQPRRIAARAAALLGDAAAAMRKAGVTAVVDVDPQSL